MAFNKTRNVFQLFCADFFAALDARIHALMARGAQYWYCTVCGKSCKIKKDVERHIEVHHIEDHPGLRCDVCGAVSKTRHALGQHKKIKHSLCAGPH